MGLYHQNIFLLLSAIKSEKENNRLFSLSVCSLENESCMTGTCAICPGIDPLKTEIINLIGEKSHIIYRQWETVDRTTLNVFEKNFDEFVDICTSKILKCLPHHYISK